MEIDDYVEENITININDLDSFYEKKTSQLKTLESCKSWIKESDYGSLLYNFEKKLLDLLKYDSKCFKMMLYITFEEEGIEFKEIDIEKEIIVNPSFKNFENLIKIIKKFFFENSKKNFYQVFIETIDLFNFFGRDLFTKRKFNYFSSDEKHFSQPKINKFINENLNKNRIDNEISINYSLYEKILFGLSEEFLLFYLNENHSNSTLFQCYVHLIRVYFGYLIIKIHSHVTFIIENFEKIIIEDENQKYVHLTNVEKTHKLIVLFTELNWDILKKMEIKNITNHLDGNSLKFEIHKFLNKNIFCSHLLTLNKSEKELFLKNSKEINKEFSKVITSSKIKQNKSEDKKSINKYSLHYDNNYNPIDNFSCNNLLKSDYQILSWAEFYNILSCNIKKLKKKCKMEKGNLEKILLISIKTFIDSYFNYENNSEESIYCLSNSTRQETLEKFHFIFYDNFNELTVFFNFFKLKSP